MANELPKIPIPNYIWESLEAALRAESRRLVRDIAKTLGKDETELMRHVNTETISAYLVDLTDPTNEKFECTAYRLSGPVQKPCRNPVVFGTTKCLEHAHRSPKPSASLPRYRLLKYYDEEKSEEFHVYLNPATNEVFDRSSLKRLGLWNPETQGLLLYELLAE